MMNIKCLLFGGSERTANVKKNIWGSLLLKGINILTTLLIVPLTIHYVNPTQYGIWLTLSTIIIWISYFDIGLSQGFRNRFSEAIAKNDITSAKEYVSTTYVLMFFIFLLAGIMCSIINRYLDWCAILKVDSSLFIELRSVFQILIVFFCINMVAGIIATLMTAYQKPALASLLTTAGQVFTLIALFIMTKTIRGSLINLSFAYSGIPCLFLILASCYLFNRKTYRALKPNIHSVRLHLTSKILGLGWQFFVIMISMLFIYQFMNILISRNFGPTAVTQYNIAYKYFNVVYMIAIIVINPFWSAFTDAYVKQDKQWMMHSLKILEKLWIATIPLLLLMLLCSSWIYRLWIGKAVNVPFGLSLAISIFVLLQTLSNIYMYLINGTGKVRIQLIIYLFFAVVAIPIMDYCCKRFGIESILTVPSIVYIIQAVFGRIQLKKLINDHATGVWNK